MEFAARAGFFGSLSAAQVDRWGNPIGNQRAKTLSNRRESPGTARAARRGEVTSRVIRQPTQLSQLLRRSDVGPASVETLAGRATFGRCAEHDVAERECARRCSCEQLWLDDRYAAIHERSRFTSHHV